LGRYQELSVEDIRNHTNKIFDTNNSNTIYYYSEN